MNNQKTATSSPVISNLVDSKNRHHLHLVTNQKAPEINAESNELLSNDLSVGDWRCVQSSVAEVVPTQCSHSWEFVPAPVSLGFAERCSHCNEVKYIEGSDKLEELIAWLSDQVEEFEQLSDKEVDERKQAYYQNCARNKQQLIKQVNRHLAKAREEEKGELLVNSSVTSELEKEESTPDEEKDRQEAIALKAEILKLISQFFVTLGEKLKIYQEKRLYRFEAKTFGEWCEQEVGIKRNYAYRLIRAFEVYKCIQSKCIPLGNKNQSECIPLGNKKENNAQSSTQTTILLPTSERQLRALTKLPKEQWFPTWVEASEQSENKNKPPSGKLVERIVKEKQRMEKQSRYQTQVDRFKVGEIVRLTAKYNQDLKEYHNCWGQVLSVEEHSYTIKAWKGEIKSVAHDDLMLLPRESKDVAENLLSKLHRSYQLHPHDPDFVAFLQYLGTKPIPEASELATKFLDFVDGERI